MMYTAMLTRRRITLYCTAYLVEFYLSVILSLSVDIQDGLLHTCSQF